MSFLLPCHTATLCIIFSFTFFQRREDYNKLSTYHLNVKWCNTVFVCTLLWPSLEVQTRGWSILLMEQPVKPPCTSFVRISYFRPSAIYSFLWLSSVSWLDRLQFVNCSPAEGHLFWADSSFWLLWVKLP